MSDGMPIPGRNDRALPRAAAVLPRLRAGMPSALRCCAALLLAVVALLLPACKRGEEAGAVRGTQGKTWTLAGRIDVPPGLDPAGVLVLATGTSYIVSTDASGQWTIAGVAPGTYTVLARRDDLVPAEAARVTLDPNGPAGGGEWKRLVGSVTMKPRGAADYASADTGAPASVVTRRGTSAPAGFGALRGVIKVLGGTDDLEGFVIRVEGTELRGATDGLGAFFFPAVPAGKWKVWASRRGWRSGEATVEVVAGKETMTTGIEISPEGIGVAGNRRVVRGQVNMELLNGGPSNLFDRVVVSLEGTMNVAVPDAAGQFVLHDIPPGKYAVMAAAPGYLLKDKIDIDLTSLEAAQVTLQLAEDPASVKTGGIVRGNATLKNPPPTGDQSGILVSLVGTNYVAVTSPEGTYEMTGIPAGTYLLRAQFEGMSPEFVDNVKVEVNQNTTVADIILEPYIVPPEVVSTDPADGAKDVMIRRVVPVSVRFSKRMDAASLKKGVSIKPAVAARIFAGRENPRSDDDLLYIELIGEEGTEPRDVLRFSTTYTITIADSVRDLEGATLREPYSFSFRTGDPTIIATNPGDGDRDVMVTFGSPIVVSVNAQLDHSSVRDGDIDISPRPFDTPQLRPIDDNISGWTQVSIVTNLDQDKEYTVRISGRWRTVDGAQIRNTPYTFKFKTYKFVPPGPNSAQKPRR